MKINPLFLFLLCCFFVSKNYAQDDTLLIDANRIIAEEEIVEDPYDPLAPARAAFYSAVLPGLGQAVNEKYWKIPIIYAGLGTGIYFYVSNNKQYHRYREVYKRRIAGYTDDEFMNEDGTPIVSTNGLIEAQRLYQRNKEMSLLITFGIYVLNIVDANVDAHLKQFNVSEDLSLEPTYDFDEFTGHNSLGVSLNFKF